MSNKLIVNRLKGVISEYITLDEFIKQEVERVKGYKEFIDTCRKDKKPYDEVKEELAKYIKSQNNFKVLQDDIFGIASCVSEVSRILDILGEEVELTDTQMEVLNACREFTKPVYFVEAGEVKIQDTEFNQYISNISEEINKVNNPIKEEYEMMINS